MKILLSLVLIVLSSTATAEKFAYLTREFHSSHPLDSNQYHQKLLILSGPKKTLLNGW